MTTDDKNPFRIIPGGKDGQEQHPINDYAVLDIDNAEFFGTGFVIFTSHHVAIMNDLDGKGPVPVLVLPLHRVKACELMQPDDEDTSDAPF